ncbi:MAG TPA: branched-chain amino acid ABC transporter permease [Acidimicrobiales bacterium]|nr:branched-chain amino acid ABC transporter permease [Acidimicrobiales bacterium]
MLATSLFHPDWGLLHDQFWALTVGGLTAGSIYALVALGYTMVYGVLRLINFANSEIFMIGTFGALFATRWLGIEPGADALHTGFFLVLLIGFCLIVAMAFSGTAAVALERVAYRPLRKRGATRLAALISAIGASLAIQEFVAFRRGRNFEAFPRVANRDVLFTFFGAEIRTDQLFVIVGALVMMVLLDQFVNRTRLGRGIRAVAQDSETATLMGVNIDRVVMLTFLLGGIMAGSAGLLFVFFFEVTKYNIGFLIGIKAFTAAVLGGIGNLRGALLGGLVLGLIENYGSALWGTEWKDPIAFLVLVLVLMVRPTGLLGEALGKARA